MGKKGNETRRMILEAAEELFAQKGFKDVSMSDICTRTGLSRGGLYRYFSSAADIFRELISADYPVADRIACGDSATDILLDTLDHVEAAIRRSEKSLSLAIYEFANIGDNRPLFTELEAKARKRWTALICYGIRTGEFSVTDPEAAAEMILYYYQGLRMWSRVIDMNSKAAENYRHNIIRLLTGGK